MRTLLGLIVVLAVISCSHEEYEPSDNAYFPLDIGNSWEYKNTVATVTDTVVKNDKVYFQLDIVNYHADTVYYSYTEYYRINTSGDVHRFDESSGKTFLVYKLTPQKEQSWHYNAGDDYQWKVMTKGAVETIKLGEQNIEKCMLFSYDIEEAVDDEHYVILAPGLGKVVSGSYAWGINDTLKAAHINGKDYTF